MSFLGIKRAFNENSVRQQLLFYSTCNLKMEKKLMKNSKGVYILTDMQNSNFEDFYKAQKICPEEDFDTMMKSCRTGLPSVLRQVT